MILLWSGQTLPHYYVEGAQIADLEVLQPSQSAVPARAVQEARSPQVTVTENLQDIRTQQFNILQDQGQTQRGAFVDPAILSFQKKPGISGRAAPTGVAEEGLAVKSPIMIADSLTRAGLPNAAKQLLTDAAAQNKASSTATPALPPSEATRRRKDSSATATLTTPFDPTALNGDEPQSDFAEPSAGGKENVPQGTVGKGASKKNRRGARKNKDPAPAAVSSLIDSTNGLPAPAQANAAQLRGKGWRQDPLIQESPPVKPGTKRTKQKGRRQNLEDQNGWATEEATDIADMPEFDFESNLEKFNKRQVFADIRRDDTTADDERLVSFNRIGKPGTSGGRNLHYTDNVLDGPAANAKFLQSEAGETEDEVHEEHYSSGKGSRRAGSRKPPPSRKGSTLPTSSLARGLSRISLDSNRPPSRVSATASPLAGSAASFPGSLRIASTNRPCPILSPLQMLELEQLCITEVGMSQDMLAENAGRGIAEAAMALVPTLTDKSNVLFLTGNHKSGARAVAGARHLRNRGLRVLVCVLGGEREDLLIEALQKQLRIYKQAGGWITKWDELQTKFSASSTPPLELVVDVLLGMHTSFDELRTTDQATAFEMFKWTNRNQAPVLSLEVPSGMDASTGEIGHADQEPLIMRCNATLSLGAPKRGILNALVANHGDDGWDLLLADIGIPRSAWTKLGSKRRNGPLFGQEWIVSLEYSDGAA